MMKLRYSVTSPFVRKVVVTAIETGQDQEIDRTPTNTADPASGLSVDNPLNKVPALLLDDGTRLYDSAVICEYLDSRKGGRMFPAAGPARWTALRRQALADGMMDAALLRRYETQRPENLRSAEWDKKQALKVSQGLNALEGEASDFGDVSDIGTLTVAVMLDYLDFRFKSDAWREGCPSLAAWYETFSKRPSLQATRPKD
ncbi:MAG TPA: glutathione S-transferase N-terminal domain-containing protein [Dongiaceae bacterium]|jgi:glutathione S-transferase